MIPRLQRFYGGAQEAWWVMPVALLRSYVLMLPRLRAEVALQAVSETMIGTGSMEKRHAERALNAWERDADGPQEPRPQMTEAERIEYYGSTGLFQVEVVDG